MKSTANTSPSFAWLLFKKIILKVQIIEINYMTTPPKAVFKIGEMLIDQKQIFWKMQYCYALIPIVQILDGRTSLTIQMS
jgi:hypothetical protein